MRTQRHKKMEQKALPLSLLVAKPGLEVTFLSLSQHSSPIWPFCYVMLERERYSGKKVTPKTSALHLFWARVYVILRLIVLGWRVISFRASFWGSQVSKGWVSSPSKHQRVAWHLMIQLLKRQEPELKHNMSCPRQLNVAGTHYGFRTNLEE
jgi:hypothetical protein